MRGTFQSAGLQHSLHLIGSLQGQQLVDAYHPMDIFAFASGLAAQLQQRLLGRGRVALLAGGSAYCDIYTGGAAEPHLCAASTGLGGLLRYANPLIILTFCLWNIPSLCRIAGVVLLELLLVLVDCVRGLINPRDLIRELRFIPSRVGMSCIALVFSGEELPNEIGRRTFPTSV